MKSLVPRRGRQAISFQAVSLQAVTPPEAMELLACERAPIYPPEALSRCLG
jgi:hypothetical protein